MQTNHNPWVELIKWSNAHDPDPTRRWNGFQAFLVAERGRIQLINEWNKKRSEQGLDNIIPLEGDELEIAKGFWEKGTFFFEIYKIDFKDVHFIENVSFKKTQFALFADFEKAEFDRNPNFESAQFSGPAYFQNAIFKDWAYFQNAKFDDWAIFHEAEFNMEFYFQHAKFTAGADFQNAKFYNLVYFQHAKFAEKANFQNAKFTKKAYFENAKFDKGADFSCTDNQPIKKISFYKAIFENHPPEFYERSLHEDTDFGFKSLPPVPKNKKTLNAHINAYERLRLQAEKLGMIEARRRFVRQELACRTADCENWGEWFVRGLYGLISDYGTSMWRPLIALGALWGVFWGIFRMLSVTDCCEPLPFNLVNGLTFTFARIFPFTAGKIDFPALEAWNCAPSFQFWSIILSLLSYILLFLFALALSSKFRMKV